MRPPVFVRPLTGDEREQLEAGLRSPDAFILRRCQMILASARHDRAPHIARSLGCNDQTVRNVIAGFNTTGLAVLERGSSRPHTIHAAFDAAQAEQLRALLHRSPWVFGKPSTIWTLPLAAEVAVEQGIIDAPVSGETIRATLARLNIRWRRAKHWITSPDPEYARKKGGATA